MLDTRLYMAQRISALLMAPLVAGHIVVMIYAVRGGLTAAEILGRTQGSFWWFLFYGLFVGAVSVHAAIGLRVIASELLSLRGVALDIFSVLALIALLALGLYAVLAVTFL